MPRSKQVDKQDILRAATEVIRAKGHNALTVRNIAAELGCSTQPLYYEFENADHLRAELLPYVRQQYLQFRFSNYKEFGRHFLNFARREKELFRFVYLRRREYLPAFCGRHHFYHIETHRRLGKRTVLQVELGGTDQPPLFM